MKHFCHLLEFSGEDNTGLVKYMHDADDKIKKVFNNKFAKRVLAVSTQAVSNKSENAFVGNQLAKVEQISDGVDVSELASTLAGATAKSQVTFALKPCTETLKTLRFTIANIDKKVFGLFSDRLANLSLQIKGFRCSIDSARSQQWKYALYNLAIVFKEDGDIPKAVQTITRIVEFYDDHGLYVDDGDKESDLAKIHALKSDIDVVTAAVSSYPAVKFNSVSQGFVRWYFADTSKDLVNFKPEIKQMVETIAFSIATAFISKMTSAFALSYDWIFPLTEHKLPPAEVTIDVDADVHKHFVNHVIESDYVKLCTELRKTDAGVCVSITPNEIRENLQLDPEFCIFAVVAAKVLQRVRELRNLAAALQNIEGGAPLLTEMDKIIQCKGSITDGTREVTRVAESFPNMFTWFQKSVDRESKKVVAGAVDHVTRTVGDIVTTFDGLAESIPDIKSEIEKSSESLRPTFFSTKFGEFLKPDMMKPVSLAFGKYTFECLTPGILLYI